MWGKFPKGLKLYSNEIIPVAFSLKGEKTSFHKDHHNPLHYFRIFINFGYFFYYIPFRLERVENSKVYIIKSPVSRKIICLCVHILSALRFAISIRKILHSYKDPSPSPVLYFQICRAIFTAVYMAVFKYTFWRKHQLFCTIANDLSNVKLSIVTLTYWKHHVKTTTLATWICIVYTILPVMSVLLGSEVINVKNLNFIELVEAYAGMARYTFLVQGDTDPVPIIDLDLATYILLPIYIAMNFYYFLGGHWFDLSVLMGCLSLRHLARIFADMVNGCGDAYHIDMILKEYSILKDFSTKINSAIGGVAFCFVVEAMPYYATHFDDILTLEDWYDRIRFIFYVVNFIVILFVAGDITVKVDSLRLWLSKGNNSSTLPSTKAIVLVNELQNCPVGLKPGGILTITYGFIGTMVSVVVTYAVIILQFNFASSQTCKCMVSEYNLTTTSGLE